MSSKPLLIGVSARIYYPGTPGIQEAGVWTKTLHYLEQSVAHWPPPSRSPTTCRPAATC